MTPTSATGSGAVQQIVEQVSWAESAGYDDVWLADIGGIDALTIAALMLQRTQRIRVGIGVVSVYTRTPAVLAATAAILADLAPGRFALGLGTSSETIVQGWHGLRLDKPAARMQETVLVLQDIFAGKKTRFSGETLSSNGYRQSALEPPVPVLLAALGTRMTELAVRPATMKKLPT